MYAVCGTLALDFRDYAVLGFPGVSFAFYVGAAVLAGWYFALRLRH